MESRRFLRPLPLVLILLFVAVAVGDLVQKLAEEPPPPPEIVGSAAPRFEPLEPVIDFRTGRTDPAVGVLPIPELAQGQWSAPDHRGVWARSAVTDLRLEFADGGHRALVLECLPASGKRRVRSLSLTINGIDCGEVELASGWKRYRFVLPEGVVRPGTNRIVFGFPDRDEAAQKRRALLIRRLGWFFEEDIGVEALDRASPVTLDLDAERVSIRRSGILEVPLVLDDRTDALQMRYRFPSGAGRAEVTVEQSGSEGAGLADALTAMMSADKRISGRVRIPLHGRRGAFALRIRADLVPPGSLLVISSLRLVEEGDPTRRPWAVNSPPSREPEGLPPEE